MKEKVLLEWSNYKVTEAKVLQRKNLNEKFISLSTKLNGVRKQFLIYKDYLWLIDNKYSIRCLVRQNNNFTFLDGELIPNNNYKYYFLSYNDTITLSINKLLHIESIPKYNSIITSKNNNLILRTKYKIYKYREKISIYLKFVLTMNEPYIFLIKTNDGFKKFNHEIILDEKNINKIPNLSILEFSASDRGIKFVKIRYDKTEPDNEIIANNFLEYLDNTIPIAEVKKIIFG